MARIISTRAREQVTEHVGYWFEDYPETTQVNLEAGTLWVDDFDGNLSQMRKLVTEEFVKRGWKLRTIKGVKTLVR